jgi:hypothetical protein
VQAELNGCFDPATGRRVRPHDETPGGASILSIYADQDEHIDPVESCCLDQLRVKDCTSPVNRRFRPACVGVIVNGACVGVERPRSHYTLHQDADVVAATIAFIQDR